MSWYFDKKELRKTPSLLDNIDFETETRYRREGARFIIDTGSKMDLGYNTTATGVVYFHRFYMYHSFKSFPRYVTACCCLFLAGKVEETPKKCKDIIRMAKSLLPPEKFLTFGDDPKEEVMTLERILLQTIKFDLQVEHPYSFLLKYAKCLKGDKVKLPKMVQMAWTFVNDSLCTTLCLQWEPEIIAVALMYLACKLNKFDVVDWVGRTTKHLRWWDMFIQDVTMELLEDICHQVLDLYAAPHGKTNPPHSPPPTRPDGHVISPNPPEFIKEGGKKVKVEVVSVGKAVPMGGGEVVVPSKVVVGTPPPGLLVGRPLPPQTLVDPVIFTQPPPHEAAYLGYPPPPPMAYPPAFSYPHPPLP